MSGPALQTSPSLPALAEQADTRPRLRALLGCRVLAGCEPSDPVCCDTDVMAQMPDGCASLGFDGCSVFTGCCEWSSVRELCETLPGAQGPPSPPADDVSG
eukprot:SAG22_NODE_6132_length_895_cov_0.795226_2_plen_101_part_00